MIWAINLLASLFPAISSCPAPHIDFGDAKATQVIHSQKINGWVLCDLLDQNFQGNFHVEMDDDKYRIWAPRKLMQNELDRCRI